MDHHTVAAFSISGICLDVLGGLYLAYDLLGGQYGPLRLLTKLVTYSIVFGIGYGIGLGFFFGVASGAATGITVAIETSSNRSQSRSLSIALGGPVQRDPGGCFWRWTLQNFGSRIRSHIWRSQYRGTNSGLCSGHCGPVSITRRRAVLASRAGNCGE